MALGGDALAKAVFFLSTTGLRGLEEEDSRVAGQSRAGLRRRAQALPLPAVSGYGRPVPQRPRAPALGAGAAAAAHPVLLLLLPYRELRCAAHARAGRVAARSIYAEDEAWLQRLLAVEHSAGVPFGPYDATRQHALDSQEAAGSARGIRGALRASRERRTVRRVGLGVCSTWRVQSLGRCDGQVPTAAPETAWGDDRYRVEEHVVAAMNEL
ncbi:hypothetical protein ON010_g18662 [Phytophthora cinnamomi]|nr:hypothetical protein ON010_g18662 [Phytophthora cinnamomi]